MNFFSKNKFVFWLLIFLIVINLSALISFFVFFTRTSSPPRQSSQKNTGSVFCRELSLTSSQSEKVNAILAVYKSSTDPVTENIRNYRVQLLEELAKVKPDTVLLNRYAEEISLFQKQMQIASIKQYLALKQICNPDQCQRLSTLYFELYGCKGRCEGMGQGKGMMHQYRKGQGQHGCGNGMRNDSCSK
jgi:hypothetical protein